MKKIQNLKAALTIFETAAINHVLATQKGDYKTGNKNYDIIIHIYNYLKENSYVDVLLPFLKHEIIGVRVIAASVVLSTHEKEAIAILKDISDSSDFYSFIAETTLKEWKKGNLRI